MKLLLCATTAATVLLVLGNASASTSDHHALRHRHLQDNATATTTAEDCDGCLVNGFCYLDGEVYPDPFCPPNECSCNAANPDLSACTLMACEESEPEEDAIFCTADVGTCSDGTYVSRVPPNCDFEDCPEGSTLEEPEEFDVVVEPDMGACPLDIKTCADGSTVVRDPANNCEFPECECACEHNGLCYANGESFRKECNSCTCNESGVFPCTMAFCDCASAGCTTPSGKSYCFEEMWLAEDGCNTCQCNADGTIACSARECVDEDEEPKVGACTMDVKTCADGTSLNRDPENNCEFPACECACQHNGLCFSAGQQYQDQCNTCTCGENGLSSCTLMACDCENNGCEASDGAFYCFGESFLSPDDGCNTCNCNENGAISCTLMACPEEDVEPAQAGGMGCAMDVRECPDGSYVSRDPANNCEFPACPEDDVEPAQAGGDDIMCAMDVRECPDGSFVSRDPANNCAFPACPDDVDPDVEGCMWNGIAYEVGEQFQEQCNTCTCQTPSALGWDATVSPISKCTRMGCDCVEAGCEVDGENYCFGESFLAADGCNTCTCNESGEAVCTRMACPEEEVPDEEGCMWNGIAYEVGEQYNEQCNTCTCGINGSRCTKMGCDCVEAGCEVNGENYCFGESFLAADGCNTCTCNESGEASCTRMACPEEMGVGMADTEVSKEATMETKDDIEPMSADTTSSASVIDYTIAASCVAFVVGSLMS